MFDSNYFIECYIEILEAMDDKPPLKRTEIMNFIEEVPDVKVKEFFKKFSIDESGIIKEKVIVLSNSQIARNVQMRSDIQILTNKNKSSLKSLKLFSSQAYGYLKKTDCNTQEIIMILEKLILGGLMKTALHEVMGISIN
jgi:hypothetical protein